MMQTNCRCSLAILLGMLLVGACHAPLTIWAQTLRMRIIPPPLRGRTFALLRMLMQGAGPLGSLAGGAALPALGLPAVLGAAAGVAAFPGLLGLRDRAMREAD